MDREQLVREDFPNGGSDGFDRDSVGAHLAAVAAHVAALKARIAALEVERETLRRQLVEAREHDGGPSGLPEPGPDPLIDGAAGAGSRQESDPPSPEPSGTPSGGPAGEDEVAARLVASKLAMEGSDRESIRKRLDADYDLGDPDALIDDVLERLG